METVIWFVLNALVIGLIIGGLIGFQIAKRKGGGSEAAKIAALQTASAQAAA